jgi:hypothetical protein
VHRWALLLLLSLLAGLFLSPVVVVADPVGSSVVLTAGVVDRRGWLDVDGDGLADVVEEGLCGSAGCARAGVDSDGDGVEFLVCGSAGCVVPVDGSGDCVPDFVPLILCDGGVCSRAVLDGDVDGDGVRNWVEVVVAGSAWLADGVEDFNGDGLSDAEQLMACKPVVASGGSGVAGQDGTWMVAVVVGLVGVVLLVWFRRRGARGFDS